MVFNIMLQYLKKQNLLVVPFAFIFLSSLYCATAEDDPVYFPKIGTVSNITTRDGAENQLRAWLSKTEKGRKFLADELGGIFTKNVREFNTANYALKYEIWHAKNYGNKVSSEQLERVKQEAIQEARTHAHSEHAVEVSQLKNQLAVTTGLLANGGNFSDAAVTQVVDKIRSAKEVKKLTAKYTEGTRDIEIGAIVDGVPFSHPFKNLKKQDYVALKLLLAAFENMYSRAYAAASQSMGNLISDILASLEPQPYHEMQIDDLSTSITGLKGHVQYHRETGTFLTDCRALPLLKFLNITFLDETQIIQLRGKAAKGFDEIVRDIPQSSNVYYGSPALTSFIEKVSISLRLQTEIPFSEDEIAAIFRELGLLLETDINGVVQTHSVYFDELLSISRDVDKFKEMVENKKDSYIGCPEKKVAIFKKMAENKKRAFIGYKGSNAEKQDEYSGLSYDAAYSLILDKVETAIKEKRLDEIDLLSQDITQMFGNDAALGTALKECFFDLECKDLNYEASSRLVFKYVNDAIKCNKLSAIIPLLQQIVDMFPTEKALGMALELRTLGIRIENLLPSTIDPVTLSWQAAGTAVSHIQAGGDSLRALRAVLFLVRRFAPNEYKKIADKLVLIAGPLDPAVEAACSNYYQATTSSRSLTSSVVQAPIDLVRDDINKKGGILFDEKAYETLRKSEAKIATKTYLETLIRTGKPPTIDLDVLRFTSLGVDTSMPERVRNGLLIRTCELINVAKTEVDQKKLKENIRALTKNCFGHPFIHTAAYYFEILNAELGDDAGKKAFLDSYIMLPVKGNSSSADQMTLQEKSRRASDFFNTALTAAAETDSLVTLVRTLPTLKRDHKAKIMGQPEIASKNQQQVIGFVERAQSFLDLYEKGKSFELLSVYKTASIKKDEQLFLLRIFDKFAQLGKISKDFLDVDDKTGSLALSSASNEESASFEVLAGLRRLDFDNIFRSERYFGDLYNASKVLNFLELMIPSDQDFTKLEAIILSATDPTEQVKIKAEIDTLVRCSKEFKAGAIALFEQIKALMQFVKDFQALKALYDEPTGRAKPLDFYADVDKIPAFEIGIPGGLFDAPPTWMYCADLKFSSGVDLAFKVTDKEMERNVFGKAFNKTSETEKTQREVAVKKVKTFYQPILDAQKNIFLELILHK